MKLLRLLTIFSIAAIILQGCTLLCRDNCRRVQYYERPPNIFSKIPCGTFPYPCPRVKVPGYYGTDLNCIERLQRFSALRARGIGIIILGDRLRFIIPTDTFFTRDTIDISDCHVTTIADIAEIIKTLPCVPIIITGHTDDVGPKCVRFKRSRAMARTVAAHLWAQGIAWDRMCVYGRADCDQIACDKSVFGSTDNRRVEIRLDFSGNYFYNCQYNNSYCPECIGSFEN